MALKTTNAAPQEHGIFCYSCGCLLGSQPIKPTQTEVCETCKPHIQRVIFLENTMEEANAAMQEARDRIAEALHTLQDIKRKQGKEYKTQTERN